MAKVVGFCGECRENIESHLVPVTFYKTIRDKTYKFQIELAHCPKCKTDLDVPGLMDKNAQAIDAQYRQMEDLVTVEEIKALMEKYNLDTKKFALVLGFNEIKVERWLQGQIPIKMDSNIVRNAISDASFMELKMKKIGLKNGEQTKHLQM